MRRMLFKYLKRNIFKVEEGLTLPILLRVIFVVLFPLRYYLLNQELIRYDIETDSYSIEGVKYAVEFFDSLARGEYRDWMFARFRRERDRIIVEVRNLPRPRTKDPVVKVIKPLMAGDIIEDAFGNRYILNKEINNGPEA